MKVKNSTFSPIQPIPVNLSMYLCRVGLYTASECMYIESNNNNKINSIPFRICDVTLDRWMTGNVV